MIEMEPGEIPVLREARALCAAGWTQGYAMRENENGRSWCMTGAITYAEGSYVQKARARMRLREVVGWSIERWNDAEDRTLTEVLAAFDRAIELTPERLAMGVDPLARAVIL